MPEPIAKICNAVGCGKLTTARYCQDCKQQRSRDYNRQQRDPESQAFYNSTAWKRLRLMVLNEEPLCRVCQAAATVVDHIKPISEGGPKTDRENLQSLCKQCHDRKTANEAAFSSRRTCEVILVAGPPGAGKTTYVEQQFNAGDMVVDFDRLAQALSFADVYHKPADELLAFTLAARDAIVQRLLRKHLVKRVWLIEQAPSTARRKTLRQAFGARVVVLKPTSQKCKERIEGDQTRSRAKQWSRLVDDWFRKYEPDDRDQVIEA